MANVRCPMCSKLNPPEAEVCSYCGARLKPLRLTPSGPTKETPGGAGSSQNDEPDWLRDLRAGSPGAGESTAGQQDAPAEDADVPDWLSRIRDRARTETSSSSSDLFGGDNEEKDWMQETQGEGADGQNLDEWLSRLPGGETSQPQEPQASPSSGEMPGMDLEPADWLRGLSDEGTGGTTGEAKAGMPEDTPGGEDDWMSKLSAWQAGFTGDTSGTDASVPDASASAGRGTPAEPAISGAEDEFGWLNNLNTEGETPSEQPAEQPFSSGTGLTSFLSSLEAEETGQPPAGKDTSAGPGNVFSEEGGFDWAAPETKPAHEEPSSGFGLTGFLSQIEEGSQPEETAPTGEMKEDVFTGWNQPAEPPTSGDMPSWISGETPASAAPFESGAQPNEQGVPDWLKGLESAAESEQAAQAEDTGFAPEGNMPSWLQETGAEAPAAPSESGLPAWLSSDEGTASQAEEQPFVLPQDQPQGEKSDLPAWLFADESAPQEAAPHDAAPSLSAPKAEEPIAQPPAFTSDVEASQPAEGSMPDWLKSDFAAAGEGTVEESAAAATAGGEADLPDWFASFDQSEIEKTQPSRVTGGLKPPSGQLPPILASSQEPGADEPAGQPAGIPAEEILPADEQPDWLRAFQGSAEEEESTPTSPLLSSAKALDAAGKEGDQPFTVDLPEWLGEDEAVAQTERQPEEAGGLPVEASSDQLAQAELPDWVREMRPLESILPGEIPAGEMDQRVEKAGPLAGMRGVLPVEDLATRYRKPPTYTIKLQVTEKQRTQSSLLESILSQESQSLLIPPARAAGTGTLMRVLVAAFLLIALAFPVVFSVGMLAAPDPERFPAETQMFEMINERLQSSSSGPVLLAIEYEPGLSGEMRMAANAVVTQLVERKAVIALVSTVPAGPAMGQQLLDDVDENYTNQVTLGFLPGGTISLVDFARQPRRAAPATLDNQPAWSGDALLKDVDSLDDFSQVIVLTDRAEVGRAWVEQVQPELGDVPLFMVASAQAAPLLQPYVESKQITGMTSGMLGGAMYAQLTGQDYSQALSYLSAYQIGVVLAFAVVLVGGVISGGLALFRRKDREEE